MIRELIITVFFFFGPALVMVVLRNLVLLLLLRARMRRDNPPEPEIIDITPVDNERAPTWFYALVVVISLACAVTVFLQLEKQSNVEEHQYIPAHIGTSGNIVPGGWKHPN